MGSKPRKEQSTTRQKLLASFASLVNEKSYFDISISDVSKGAGLSTSSFYTYFESKKDLLSYYLQESLGTIEGMVRGLLSSTRSPSILVRSLIYTLSTFADNRDLAAFHRVFREIEFIDTTLSRAYYETMLRTIGAALSERLASSLSQGEYTVLSAMLLGMAQFIHLFSTVFGLKQEREPGIEAAGDLLIKGLARDAGETQATYKVPRAPKLLDLISEYGILDNVKNKVKRKLIEASLEVLSRKTFRSTKVYEICDASGYAVGMFYKAYNSKNDLLRDILHVIGRTLRHYLTTCTEDMEELVAVEVKGTACFLGFVEANAQIYRIVRESEYIDLGVAKEYYIPFRKAYESRLANRITTGKITALDPKPLATSLMGINHVLGITGPILKIIGDNELVIETTEKIYRRGILGLLSGHPSNS
ncbi:MAG: TetR/AcrR family transcriptional regulator [Desulfurococcales archaeon]|nr:TetR/AcrR family transcriptional regulator [Desulfurococcales archaeon]